MYFSIKKTFLSMQYMIKTEKQSCAHHRDNKNCQGLINMQDSDWNNTNLLIVLVNLKRNHQYHELIYKLKYITTGYEFWVVWLDYVSRLSNQKTTLFKRTSGTRLCRMSTSSDFYQSWTHTLYIPKALSSSSFPNNRSAHECHSCCTKPIPIISISKSLHLSLNVL